MMSFSCILNVLKLKLHDLRDVNIFKKFYKGGCGGSPSRKIFKKWVQNYVIFLHFNVVWWMRPIYELFFATPANIPIFGVKVGNGMQ